MSITQISRGQWQASVASHGAELQSLTHTGSGEEFLWHGDPAIWGGRAPILFPIIGRLKDNRIRCRAVAYPLTRHGIARQSVFQLLGAFEDCVSFELCDSPASRELYPYPFALRVDISLTADGLITVDYAVTNRGDDTMWFTLGSHPAFCLPLENSRLSDYAVVLPDDQDLIRYTLVDGLMPAQGAPLANNPITLSETLFDEDALIFRDIRSRQITLQHRTHGPRIVVDTGGAPHLGIWAKPGAGYVCIEPWYGYDDPIDATGDIESKPGMIALAPSDTWTHTLTIRAIPTLTAA